MQPESAVMAHNNDGAPGPMPASRLEVKETRTSQLWNRTCDPFNESTFSTKDARLVCSDQAQEFSGFRLKSAILSSVYSSPAPEGSRKSSVWILLILYNRLR